MITIEVALVKNTIETSGGSYSLHLGDRRVIGFPMPEEVMNLVYQGYTIAGVRAREDGVTNYDYQLP